MRTQPTEVCDLRSHQALKSDPVRWNALAYVGRMYTSADEFGPSTCLELRNCTCGSTLAITLW